MAGGSMNEEDEITAINVTPLVDVMLVLLIIFMVTATYIVHRSINIKLPKAETGSTEITTRNLAFTLDKQSNLYLDGKATTYNELPQIIQETKKTLLSGNKRLNLQALISADTKTPHGDVVKLIDTVRKLGIIEFAVNVEAKSLQ